MYGIADKYGIFGLKYLSTERLKAALQDQGWYPFVPYAFTPAMLDEIEAAVRAAWTCTPQRDKGVRDPLIDWALRTKKVLVEVERFKLLIQQIPEFACDLIARAGGMCSVQPPEKPPEKRKRR